LLFLLFSLLLAPTTALVTTAMFAVMLSMRTPPPGVLSTAGTRTAALASSTPSLAATLTLATGTVTAASTLVSGRSISATGLPALAVLLLAILPPTLAAPSRSTTGVVPLGSSGLLAVAVVAAAATKRL